MRLSYLNLSRALAATALFGLSVNAEETSTVSTAAENAQAASTVDAYGDLPANHVLHPTTEGVVQLAIDMMGVADDENLRVAAFDSRGLFVDTHINGSTLSLYGISPGPVSVVINGKNSHAAAVFMVSDDVSVAANADASDQDATFVAKRNAEMMPQIRLTNTSPEKAKEALSRLDREVQGRLNRLDAMQVGQPTNGFVKLGPNGELKGRVISLSNVAPESVTVYLYRGNHLVVTADSDAMGQFSVPGLEPGAYSVIASGPAGYSAFGIIAGSETEDAVASNSDASVLVNRMALQDPEGVLPVPVIPQPLLDPTIQQIDEEEIILLEPGVAIDPVGAPIGGPIASPFGGFTGGGGGGGGFGGFGGLGGLGAAAAIFAATADDDNDAVTAPVVASPVVPN